MSIPLMTRSAGPLSGIHPGAQVIAGELLVVVGQVGAGKSSLLSAMLGEMRLQQVSGVWKTEERLVPSWEDKLHRLTCSEHC